MRQTRRMSPFYYHSRKTKVKDLLNRISESQQQAQVNARAIHEIMEGRLNKLREIRSRKHTQIIQGSLKPPSSIQCFANEKPISSGERYLLERKRLNILSPDKTFNPQPNMKAGSVDRSKLVNHCSEQSQQVVNKKFQEYVRVVNQQSGALKRKRVSDCDKKYSLPALCSPRAVPKMKKTYFKKFPSDQYNFYKPPIQNITRVSELASQRSSIDSSRSIVQSRSLLQSGSKQYHTIDSYEGRSRKVTQHSKTLDLYQF